MAHARLSRALRCGGRPDSGPVQGVAARSADNASEQPYRYGLRRSTSSSDFFFVFLGALSESPVLAAAARGRCCRTGLAVGTTSSRMALGSLAAGSGVASAGCATVAGVAGADG